MSKTPYPTARKSGTTVNSFWNDRHIARRHGSAAQLMTVR